METALSGALAPPLPGWGNVAGAAVGYAGTADQVVPEQVAVLGLERDVERHLLGIGVARPESRQVPHVGFFCEGTPVRFPRMQDRVPWRTLESSVLLLHAVM